MTIDVDASDWTKVPNLDALGVTEPPRTHRFSSRELRKVSRQNSEPLDLLKLPCHSQSVERSVKLMTWAFYRVYSQEARHRLCSATPQF